MSLALILAYLVQNRDRIWNWSAEPPWGRMTRSTRTLLLCSLLLLSPLLVSSSAQVQDERAVRVAFVFNLTKYVEWPHPGSELLIGFIGEGTMGEMLQKMLNGKTTDSRTIRVLISPSDEELEHCQVLYVGYASSRKIRLAVDKVRNKRILTIGEADSFAQDGGMVGLVRARDQIQIQVNLAVTQEAQLKISSRLLSLSTIVHTAPEGRN